MDSTLDDTGGDTGSSTEALGVSVDSLSIDGTAPSAGDHIECKVAGTVTKVLDGVAYFTPETANDSPIKTDRSDDLNAMGDRLQKAAMAADSGSMPGY